MRSGRAQASSVQLPYDIRTLKPLVDKDEEFQDE